MFSYKTCYGETEGCVKWQGKQAVNNPEFIDYLHNSVQVRLRNEDLNSIFSSDLSALVTTDMAGDTLRRLLLEPAQDPEPWEIGEALAECILEEEGGVSWPWNMERDKRTPKACLPGADLVGFITINQITILALGEVKTSEDTSAPPSVMDGRSGMIYQLDNLASNIQVHRCLIKWLHPRCKNTHFWPMYQEAVKNYLNSGGKTVMLFGMLMRDTTPNNLDLENRGKTLSSCVEVPTSVELCAWYLPSPISQWNSILAGG